MLAEQVQELAQTRATIIRMQEEEKELLQSLREEITRIGQMYWNYFSKVEEQFPYIFASGRLCRIPEIAGEFYGDRLGDMDLNSSCTLMSVRNVVSEGFDFYALHFREQWRSQVEDYLLHVPQRYFASEGEALIVQNSQALLENQKIAALNEELAEQQRAQAQQKIEEAERAEYLRLQKKFGSHQ